MTTLRLAAYELLTQAIVLLGQLRARIMRREWWQHPPGRVFDLYHEDRHECCDCGLVHDASYFGPDNDCGHEPLHPKLQIVGHMWPMRPKGYRYQLRIGAAKPDLAIPKKGGAE